MRRLGRYQLRVRRLLLLPPIVAISWWLAIAFVDRQRFEEMASYHAAEEAIYHLEARAPIPAFYAAWVMDRNRRCRYVKRALSEFELTRERQVRQQAARL